MRVTVLYFASLREALDCAREEVTPSEDVRTLAELRSWLAGRAPRWAPLATLPNMKMALNQAMARPDALLVDGAEVAFFPPVTGG
jgi:molybdopterin synthase sulfur carrier subunit